MRIPFTKKLTMFVTPLSTSTNPIIDFYNKDEDPVAFWDGRRSENQLEIYGSGTFTATNLVEIAAIFRELGE